jgi:hypothetical protein
MIDALMATSGFVGIVSCTLLVQGAYVLNQSINTLNALNA